MSLGRRYRQGSCLRMQAETRDVQCNLELARRKSTWATPVVLTIHRLLLRQECSAPCESARWIKRRFGKQTTTLDFSQGGSPETTTTQGGGGAALAENGNGLELETVWAMDGTCCALAGERRAAVP